MIVYASNVPTLPHLFWYHTALGGAALYAVGPISAWRIRHSAHIVDVPVDVDLT